MNLIVDRDKALSLLSKHQAEHANTYYNTVQAWMVKTSEYTELLKTWANAGGDQGNKPTEPPKPTDYTKEYARLIQKLRVHVPATIEIDEHEFDQIFNDKFIWSRGFNATSSFYGSSNSVFNDD